MTLINGASSFIEFSGAAVKGERSERAQRVYPCTAKRSDNKRARFADANLITQLICSGMVWYGAIRYDTYIFVAMGLTEV